MWKKLMAVLVCCLALVVGACGETASTAAPAGGNKAAAAADSSAAAEGKTLVVYFSNTGNTKKVAEALAQETGGTLYAIEAAQPYTAADLDYNNSDSRSVKEHKDPSIRPAIKGDVADWGSYKTVYIGYPIWWGQAPNILYTFVENHNFDGKKVIPFATSYSSSFGSSGSNLAKAAKTGNWQEGKRFAGGAGAAEVKDWLKK